MISMQRLTGKLGGRDGTFVLQGKETAENGAKEVLKATFEKGVSDGLDYWLERSSLCVQGQCRSGDIRVDLESP